MSQKAGTKGWKNFSEFSLYSLGGEMGKCLYDEHWDADCREWQTVIAAVSDSPTTLSCIII